MSEVGPALIVVDMQNAFVRPTGPAAVDGAERVLTEVNRRVDDAVRDGRPVFYTRDVEPTELPTGDPDGHADLHPDLDVRGTVVEKGPGRTGGFSGFGRTDREPGRGTMTELAELLGRAGVDGVEVVGLAADVCVAATARDARRLGFAVRVPLAATAFVHAHPEGDDAAVADLRHAGVEVVT